MKMMLLVTLYGHPGVGKLSVAQELAGAGNHLLVHDHLTIETAAALFPFGTEDFSKLRSSLFSRLVDGACSTRRTIIVTHANDIFWDPPFEQIISDSLNRHGYDRRRVFIHCADYEHARRISDPSRREYRKIQSLGRLHKLIEAGEFAELQPRQDDFVLDTTNSLPAAAAHDIASWLGLLPEAQRRAV